jgi:ABC-type multidrug transport system permease subunit
MLAERATILWVFVMPIVFFFFIGTVTGGFAGPEGAPRDPLVLHASPGDGVLLGRLEKRLADREFAVTVSDSAHVLAGFSRVIHVPPAFTDSVRAGAPVVLRAELAADGMTGSFDEIRVRRAVYTLLADVIAVSGDEETESPALATESFDRLDALPRTLTIAARPAGERRRIPTGFEQAVPGTMVMFTLLVMGTSGAILLVIERRQGLLKRLAYTPITRGSVVLGKWAGKLALGLVQLLFAMLTGWLLFHVDWGPNLWAVAIVLVAYAAMMASIGIFLGTIARTEGQAAAIGVIAANLLGALGGCWWPIEIAAPWMQTLQLFLPTGWAMHALHTLVSFGAPPERVVPHVVSMLATTAVLLAVTAKRFRYV